jgi:hypothetical protein
LLDAKAGLEKEKVGRIDKFRVKGGGLGLQMYVEDVRP